MGIQGHRKSGGLLGLATIKFWMWENTDQGNSEYRHFSHSVYCSNISSFEKFPDDVESFV